jgi:hypothetical protein
LLIRSWECSLRRHFTQQLATTSTAAPSPQTEGTLFHEPLSEKEDQEKITPLHPENPSQDLSHFESSIADHQQRHDQLSDELRTAMHQIRQLTVERNDLQAALLKIQEEHQTYQCSTEELMKNKESSSSTLEKTVVEQRAVLEQKQHLIIKLESQVRDLNYEVKTLLQLGDMASSEGNIPNAKHDNIHPVLDGFTGGDSAMDIDTLYQSMPTSSDKQIRSPYDATLQMQHCVELAQNLVGAAHLGSGNSRFSEVSVDSQALDLRRLADKFRSEISAPVLLYSPGEDKLLFASNQIQGLFGWSPDKVVNDFFNLLQEGREEWYRALDALNEQDEVQLRLVVKAKSGHDVMVYSHLAPIRSGVFTNHAIAVLYPLT